MTQYSIERFLSIQSCYGGVFLDDDDTLVFLSTITDVPQVWQIQIDTEGRILWPDQLTFDKERILWVVTPAVQNDPRILFGRDTGGNENIQLLLMDTKTGLETALTEGYSDAMHIFGEWSPDTTAITFAANRRDKARFDLYVQSLDDGEAQLVYENQQPGYLFDATFSPDQSHILVTLMQGSFYTALLDIDITARTARTLADGTTSGIRYTNAAYLDEGCALILTDHDADFTYIACIDIETGDIEPLIQMDWSIEALKLSYDKTKLLYSVNQNGASQVYLHNLTTGESSRIPTGNAPGVVSDMSFCQDDRRIALSYQQVDRTSDIYIYILSNRKTQQVTRSSHCGIPLDEFVQPQLIHYPTFDAPDSGSSDTPRMIPAWFYQPTGGDAPHPVVVIVHGGPEGQSRATFSGVVQYFVHNGYAVLLPNVRGSVGYGKAYSHLDDKRNRLDSVKDLAHAAYWLQAREDIDSERLVVYGGSYGGFMVLSAMTTYPELWAAGVNIVGISNFVTFLENTSEYRRAHREAEYGSLADDREFLERISPMNHLDQFAAPLMVIHGANDPRVPLSEAEQLVAALRQRDIPVEFIVFDDEGHGLSRHKNKLVAYPAIVDFLEKYT